jgi:transposase, IS6 family
MLLLPRTNPSACLLRRGMPTIFLHLGKFQPAKVGNFQPAETGEYSTGVDNETYINVKGEDKYLYRALDSTGQTIDFLLTAKRDTAAAKRFLRRAIDASGNPMPRVINVDKNPTYPAAMEALKAGGAIPSRVVLRQCKYLNNVIEQDHRTVKKRTWLAKGYGSFASAWRTLQGIEAVEMIRKGRVRWIPKGDSIAQAAFIAELFGIAA